MHLPLIILVIVIIIMIFSFQLSHFKIPRYIEFVEEFPTTVTGKIQKFVMRWFSLLFQSPIIIVVKYSQCLLDCHMKLNWVFDGASCRDILAARLKETSWRHPPVEVKSRHLFLDAPPSLADIANLLFHLDYSENLYRPHCSLLLISPGNIPSNVKFCIYLFLELGDTYWTRLIRYKAASMGHSSYN